MAKTFNRMRIDVSTKPTDIITEVQADSNSRYLDIYLFNNGIPIDLTGHEVRIYMRKPDNTEIWNDGEITEPTNGRCQFLLTTQALARVGVLHTQISIWKENEEILSTQIFDIMITESLRTTGSIESSNEYGALVVLFQNLYEAHDLMTTMVENIGNPSEVAAQYNLATMWQAWEFLTDYMKTDLTQMIEQALANASVQGVLDKIGNTADTGGSDVAGTTMAKLNHLIGKTLDGIAGVTSQTKKFTQTVKGLVSKQRTTTINGSGRILVWSSSGYDMYVRVDGGNKFSLSIDNFIFEIYFNESIILSNEIPTSDALSEFLCYIVQT